METKPKLPSDQIFLKAIQESLQDGEDVIFWCKGGGSKLLLQFLLISFLSIIVIYFYDLYSGHDYYGVLATFKDVSEQKLADKLSLIGFPIALYLALRDRNLLVITNQAVLYIWWIPLIMSIMEFKRKHNRRIDLSDIASVQARGNCIDVHCVKPAKGFIMSGVSDVQSTVEEIKKILHIRS